MRRCYSIQVLKTLGEGFITRITLHSLTNVKQKILKCVKLDNKGEMSRKKDLIR
jgi:hypothetical protein